MSSLFNYELDEKNIRSTLQNARYSEFSEAAWRDFEENYCKENGHSKSPIAFVKFPEFNLNINRNVILPVFFILALVGVSALLLSFIDFKPDEGQAEKKLQPNPDNYKVVSAPVKKESVSTPPAAKKETPVAIEKKDTVLQPAVTPPVNAAPLTQNLSANSVVATNNQNASRQASFIPQQRDTLTAQNTTPKLRRKKKEKAQPEQIETIKAPDLIKVETETTETEPELEIKLD